MQSKHFTARLRQRGITSDVVDILRLFGYQTERDRIVLTAKNCLQIEKFIDKQIEMLSKSGKRCSLFNGSPRLAIS